MYATRTQNFRRSQSYYNYRLANEGDAIMRALPCFFIIDAEGDNVLIECRCVLYYKNIQIRKVNAVRYSGLGTRDEDPRPEYPEELTLPFGMLLVHLFDVNSGKAMQGTKPSTITMEEAGDEEGAKTIMKEIHSLVLTCPAFGMISAAQHLKYKYGGTGYDDAFNSFFDASKGEDPLKRQRSE